MRSWLAGLADDDALVARLTARKALTGVLLPELGSYLARLGAIRHGVQLDLEHRFP
jgi:hypothetical protein